ncbi:MAG: tRNA (adenosine(37)-N6)-dimethylallyltransferase MiaA [Bacteroidia bacterium]|nr:tRNA (adenosine(37)-N6)-dimethylallyltransferase MiaA [Bacteroidia bacterium]
MTGSGNRLIVITGPTASGKTALALELAGELGCPVINADSRQIYREMPIGSAAPTAEDLRKVQHHLVGSHSVSTPLSAGEYESLVIPLAESLFKDHPHLILCGGSGLYIDAVLSGFDSLPAIPDGIRDHFNRIYEEQGLSQLKQLLKEADPEYYEQVDPENPRRMIRALEICSLGTPYSRLREGKKKKRNFAASIFCIQTERKELEARIRKRTSAMISGGLKEEVQRLLPYKNTTPLQTVGYREMFEYLEGKITETECMELINIHTRQYAKRQETWFRKKECRYVLPSDAKTILDSLGR